MLDQKILDAFQLMWGMFPEPVMLLHKNRDILAVNDFARNAGVPAGVKCYSLNPTGVPDEHCKHCKAHIALRENRAVVSEEQLGAEKCLGYWIPVPGVADVYVHFGIGTADPVAKEVLFGIKQPVEQPAEFVIPSW